MCSAHIDRYQWDNYRAASQKRRRAPVFRLTAMVFGILVLTSTIGRPQNLLSNGSLTTSVGSNSAQAIGTTSTFIANWQSTNNSVNGGNNYSVNGNQTADDFFPNPPASAPSTFSVALDSSTSGANNGHNNTLSYSNTVALLGHAQYDLSFYLNSEPSTGGPPSDVGTSAMSSLSLATGLGLTITKVTMVNAGSATGTHVATGFSNTISGTTVNLTAPATASGSTSATQPWVKVDIIFSTANPVTLPGGSILFTDLGNPTSGSNNSSVGDFSLTLVTPEICDWRIIAGFCVLCVALGSGARRKRTSRRLILNSGGRSQVGVDAGVIHSHKAV